MTKIGFNSVMAQGEFDSAERSLAVICEGFPPSTRSRSREFIVEGKF